MLKEEKLPNTGYMNIDPAGPLCAGSRCTLRLAYYPGEIGIKKGGSIRITIPHGFTTPQTEEFLKDGFVTAECPKDEVSISLEVQSRIYCVYQPKLGHSGAFGKSLFVHLDEGELKKGDSIEITYGNTDYYGQETWGPKPPKTPILSGKYEFTVGIDPDGSGKGPITGYYLLPHSPSITVTPAEKAEIYPLAPSNIDRGKDFSLHLILTDRYLNPIPEEVRKLPVRTKPEGKNFSKKIANDIILEETSERFDKFTYFKVNLNQGIQGRSNPIKFGNYRGSTNLYWGDLHTHSKYSDGMGTPVEILSYAQNVVGLDFGSVTDHDDIGPYLAPSEWEDIQEKTAKFNQPNKFITFLGYEYRSSLADGYEYLLSPRYGKANVR